MQSTPSPVNIVLLFADEDEAWRVVLLNHLSDLKREGQITLWDVSHIAPGTDRVKATRQHLERAVVILLLVSAACLTSHDREIEQAVRRQMSGDVLIIPILLHPVDWHNTRLARFQPLPGNFEPISTWQSQDAAFAEVAIGIRKALPEALHLATHTPSSTLPPIWNIPYPRNPYFTGRDDLLKRIETQLQKGTATALSQAQAISGLGGIGKTQIAVEYAYRHRNDYEAVLWMLVDTRESLVSGYITLAELLDLPEKEAKEQEITIEAAKNWLQTHDSWLLILDNADDLTLVREFIPPTFGGHILLTTRARTMGRLASLIEVETMDQDTGALFLLRRAGLIADDASLDAARPTDATTARSISVELGGLPLALDQAGAFIEESQCSLRDYQRLYRTQRAELLKERGGLVEDHREPVATTWSISFRKVEEKNKAAADLLRLCAFLAPDAIPEELFIAGAKYLGPNLSPLGSDPLSLNKALAAPGAYSLIRRDAHEKTLSIHRLVQAVLKDAMDEPTRKQWAERAVKSVNEVFPEVEFERWPQCERYLPHALMCAELIEKEKSTFPEAGRLFNRAGWYLKERARYSEAEPLLRQGLAIRQQCFEPMHHDIANSLSTLGYLYYAQGRFTETEPVWQQALTIDEAVLGSEDHDIAADLNNLASLYWNQGKYEQAEPLYQRALAIDEKAYGPQHPDVATDLNNLAALYKTQGKYEQAEPLYQRALAICEQRLGANHPNTAASLNNLAELYRAQGKYEQAEPLYQRALAIHEQQLGANHPSTAISLGNLAQVYIQQSRYTEAASHLQRALVIFEQQLGLLHPHTATCLSILAELYQKQEEYEQAEPLFKRALLIREQTLGLEHPSTQSMQQQYVQLLRKTGRDKEATALETTGQLPSDEH